MYVLKLYEYTFCLVEEAQLRAEREEQERLERERKEKEVERLELKVSISRMTADSQSSRSWYLREDS